MPDLQESQNLTKWLEKIGEFCNKISFEKHVAFIGTLSYICDLLSEEPAGSENKTKCQIFSKIL